MRIAFVSESSSVPKIFPEMQAILEKKIKGLETEQHFVPFVEDIPLKAKELVKKADIVFVLVLYKKLSYRVKMLMEKLVDLELETGTKIVKAVRESELEEDASASELQSEKQSLVEDWCKFLLDYLYSPESFAPKHEAES